MSGFRLVAIIVGIICLAVTAGLFFHRQPCVVKTSSWLLQGEELRSFIKSGEGRDLVLKDHLKYVMYGGSLLTLGLGLMFFIAAAQPIRMRPFVVVVVIASILGVAVAIWAGITMPRVSPLWWGSDAAGALILAILLLVLFPKEKRPEKPEPKAEIPPEEE